MLFLSVERIKNPAKGRDGGLDGAPGCITVQPGNRQLPGKGEVRIKAGETLTFETPGGGGFGPPQERLDDAVQNDLRAGLVTQDMARTQYRRQT